MNARTLKKAHRIFLGVTALFGLLLTVYGIWYYQINKRFIHPSTVINNLRSIGNDNLRKALTLSVHGPLHWHQEHDGNSFYPPEERPTPPDRFKVCHHLWKDQVRYQLSSKHGWMESNALCAFDPANNRTSEWRHFWGW